MFKQRRINKLKIRIAGLKASLETLKAQSERVQNSMYDLDIVKRAGWLAECNEELRQIEGE